MYMKINSPDLSPAKALPTFIMQNTPPIVAGIIMATLLVTLVGTGAGIALGVSSMICNDIYKVYFNKNASDKALLNATRIIIALLLVTAALFTGGNMGGLILGWSFMSMGLRGAVGFAPLCCALFLPGRIDKQFALYAIIAGPLFVLIGKFVLPKYIDPLFLCVGISILTMIIGYFVNEKKAAVQSREA
jgi:SSS family solute:Na+ symporter